jgi:tetratricopeptide (TPR) repeat protein
VATKIKKKAPDILDQPVVRGDVEQFVERVKQNPVLYGVSAAFLLLCVVAGGVYRIGKDTSVRTGMTQYAQAVDDEDPALREAELEPLAKGRGPVAAQALYMMGEAAFEARQYDKAKEAFERLRSKFPDSSYVPDAVEGIGYLAENQGQYEPALTSYKEILEKWPTSFTARRQELNIARCQEELGNFQEAIGAYQAQADGFPGSVFEKDANAALERLRVAHSDLFPKGMEEQKAAAPTSSTVEAASTAPEGPPPAAPAEPKPEGAGVPAPAETPTPAPAPEGSPPAAP